MLFGEAKLSDGLPAWRIVVAQPLAEAFAPVRRAAILLGAALAGILIAALAVAARRAHRRGGNGTPRRRFGAHRALAVGGRDRHSHRRLQPHVR
jgi:hypothetical protein